MSRKIRVPKGQVLELPTPVWTFALLTGRDPGCRLAGWVKQAQGGMFGEPNSAQVWAQHQGALTEEAQAHDFAPYWATKKKPSGAGFDAWATAFLQAHRY